MKNFGLLRGRKSVKLGAAALSAAVLMTVSGGCAKKDEYKANKAMDTSEKVKLIIAGRTTDSRAIDIIMSKFGELYPNCSVEYERLQDFDETLPKRLVGDEDRVDMFLTSNIKKSSPLREYALDLLECSDKLKLEDTFEGLVDNFKYIESSSETHLYSVPIGAEMRGLYVNTTLLDSLGIDVPTNRTELIEACRKLSEAGYIPLEDNPGSFGQRLLFPYIAHIIVDSEEKDIVRGDVVACNENAAEHFRDPMRFLYTLSEEKYYNYKVVETEYDRFTDLTNEGMARSFLNIKGSDGVYEKADDIGEVPFMTSADSLKPDIEKAKNDYHSNIEYRFILAPVTDEGGYAYMSPCNGLAVNKSSENIDWCLEFMNFFFNSENNKLFASENNITPNTTDALEIISRKYGIPLDQINQPADVTFDYNFFNLINPSLISVSKSNCPKYMKDDGNGGYTMYDFEYYMDGLKEAFAQQKALSEGAA